LYSCSDEEEMLLSLFAIRPQGF